MSPSVAIDRPLYSCAAPVASNSDSLPRPDAEPRIKSTLPLRVAPCCMSNTSSYPSSLTSPAPMNISPSIALGDSPDCVQFGTTEWIPADEP